MAIVAGVSLQLNCSARDQARVEDGASQGGEEGAAAGAGGALCNADPGAIYQARIEPLLTDDNPKTCNQCHLSGVNFSLFVRSTPCETMACLVSDGLVDLASPEASKILGWIERASPDSELITEQVIASEYDGFLQWIESAARCPDDCKGVTCGPPDASAECKPTPAPRELAPEDPLSVGCSDAQVERHFFDDVYAWRGRCSPCHFSNQPLADAEAPRWIRTEGNCAAGSLETLRAVVGSGYMNLEEPSQSLLLLKPLAESAGGVKHGGSTKFANTTDAGYRSFLRFIEYYAACQASAATP